MINLSNYIMTSNLDTNTLLNDIWNPSFNSIFTNLWLNTSATGNQETCNNYLYNIFSSYVSTHSWNYNFNVNLNAPQNWNAYNVLLNIARQFLAWAIPKYLADDLKLNLIINNSTNNFQGLGRTKAVLNQTVEGVSTNNITSPQQLNQVNNSASSSFNNGSFSVSVNGFNQNVNANTFTSQSNGSSENEIYTAEIMEKMMGLWNNNFLNEAWDFLDKLTYGMHQQVFPVAFFKGGWLW